MEEETVWCHEVSPACQMLGIPSAPIHRARHQANPTRQGTPPWLQSQAGIHLFLYSDNQLVPRYCPQLEWMLLFSLLGIMCFLTVLAILLDGSNQLLFEMGKTCYCTLLHFDSEEIIVFKYILIKLHLHTSTLITFALFAQVWLLNFILCWKFIVENYMFRLKCEDLDDSSYQNVDLNLSRPIIPGSNSL